MTKLGFRRSFAGLSIELRDFIQAELFSWILIFLFLDYNISGAIFSSNWYQYTVNIVEFASSDFFILIGWVVCIWRLLLGGARRINSRAFVLAIIFCIASISTSQQLLPALMALFALWIWVSGGQNSRAAAAIMFAMSSRLLWSHLIFNAFSREIVDVDTFFVGKAVVFAVKGAEVHENIVRVPSGHSIAIMEGCSSFANVASSLLGWVIFSKIERAAWCRRDIYVGVAIVITQVFLNVVRIFLMAQSLGYYEYWHNGLGSQFYVFIAAASVVIISVNGSKWAGRS